MLPASTAGLPMINACVAVEPALFCKGASVGSVLMMSPEGWHAAPVPGQSVLTLQGWRGLVPPTHVLPVNPQLLPVSRLCPPEAMSATKFTHDPAAGLFARIVYLNDGAV